MIRAKINRRDAIKWGVLAPSLVSIPAVVRAQMPQGLDAFVVDTRFGMVPPDVSAATVHTIDGDVTRLWFDTLDARWRQPGFVLGGITGADALFVLDVLARDRGRRVIARRELPARADAPTPVSWVIAPVHSSVLG